MEEQKDSAKMKKQVEQHGEDWGRENRKWAMSWKKKGNKVSALRTLGEGHDQEQKKSKEGREWREERKGEKKKMCRKSREAP